MTKYWVTKVVEQDGNLGMIVPAELLQSVDWKIGELLKWELNSSGSIIISKTNIISSGDT
jgi:antitoxin component of MazEF toxin-antitoxin module